MTRSRAPEHHPCDRCGRPSVRLVREDLGFCARHVVNFDGPYRVATAMAPRAAAQAAT